MGSHGTQKARATGEDTGSSGQSPLRQGALGVSVRGKAETWFLGLLLDRAQSLLIGILSDQHIFTSLAKVAFLQISFLLAC